MIRLATKKDMEAIYILGVMLHENYRKVNNLDVLMNEKHFKFFVAEEEKKIVGFLSVTELYETVDINDLFVLPEYRRQHFASRLINYMISDVSDSVLLFTLEVSVLNKEAIALYRKFGFDVICKRLLYYSNQDAYLMGLRCNKE